MTVRQSQPQIHGIEGQEVRKLTEHRTDSRRQLRRETLLAAGLLNLLKEVGTSIINQINSSNYECKNF